MWYSRMKRSLTAQEESNHKIGRCICCETKVPAFWLGIYPMECPDCSVSGRTTIFRDHSPFLERRVRLQLEFDEAQ